MGNIQTEHFGYKSLMKIKSRKRELKVKVHAF
jgi:hypothetical protein